MSGLDFFGMLPMAMHVLAARKPADKQANIAMDGLARKLGCNPFICRQY
jgi:hypothetical protein